MQILVLSDWYPRSPEDPLGSFVRNHALAAGHHHEVAVLHLAPPRPGFERPRLEEGRGEPLRTLRLHRGSGWTLTAGNLAGTALALRRLRRDGFEPDLLHAHEVAAGLAAVVVGGARRLPVVVSEHFSGFAMGEVRGIPARMARAAFARADLVCPVSESFRARLEGDGWRARFRVVPNVVDVDCFTPGSVALEGPPRIVTVAALKRVKGVEGLVEAVGAVARRGHDFHLDLVGEGPLREPLARRVRELGVDHRVTLHGTLPQERVAALMQHASFAVVPSEWETFSVALGEAMACGLPVVATDVGGIPERVHDGNGVLVPPRDPERLADAIAEMLGRHGSYDREAIAEEAARFSPSAIAARWDAIYEELRRARA